ncbi:hypothetical protein [Glycomyces algeriensis]|uniref:Uncharacterized protein n=1 Tax=Glycomyces algeriensis TaxID=256037 RepID=A0A9W6G892_9ACTN|nr:hypothetical protein [Glycomyces algeriensis]MDA1365898.1 hypothetical protein [Glycomyces algeriensis]MDR7349336.1 hypothetical protein [Glycomyces algeriensis]GLI42038.1 hypothetical protein GALLR39Z86_18880 [Glycomyces algeriensis]
MVNIEIRDVPQEVWDVLVADAEARGLSMQDYLLGILVEEAQRIRSGAKRERRDAQ